jgi:hypothetical protein
MPFALTRENATITSFTGRVETHGKEKRPALSLGFQIITANTILDVLSPTLRATLYKSVDEQNQEQLDGIEEVTPLLRTDGLGVIALDKTFEGWRVVVEHGIDDDTFIELAASKIDNFRVVARQGGTVELSFRVGTNALTPGDAGRLWSKNGQAVVLTVEPPEVKAPAIDGSAAAFEADYPGQARLIDPDDDREGGTPDLTPESALADSLGVEP